MATTKTTKMKTQHKDLTILHTQKSGSTKTSQAQATLWDPMYKDWGEPKEDLQQRYGVQTHLKGSATIKQMLVRPKDQDPRGCRSNIIYSYQCGEVNCDEEYIGEISKTVGGRYKEHLKEPSPIHVHNLQTGHSTNPDNFSILGREDQGQTKLIKNQSTSGSTTPSLIGI